MKIYLKRNTEFNGIRLPQGYHDLPEADAKSLIDGDYATAAPVVSADANVEIKPESDQQKRKTSGGVKK